MSRRPRRARARLSLIETLSLGGVLAVVLGLITVGVSSVRNELKERQVWEVLRLLDSALALYHDVTGAWPASADHPVAEPSPAGPDADDARPILERLAAVPASRALLDTLPGHLRVPPDDGPGFGGVRDPWGTRLHCLTAQSPRLVDRQAVAAHGGRPIFVSAGLDGEFAGRESSAAADNLRSDELPP